MRHFNLLYGYARVSTTGQSLDIQHEQLARYGCEVIRSEKKSGISTEGRAELKILLEFIREGDSLVVTRLDRLARSMYDLQKIVRTLGDRGANLVITEQSIDTSTSYGEMFINLLGTFAQFENNLRKERQLEGIAKLKARGGYNGRPKTIDDDRIVASYNQLQSVAEVCRQEKVSRASVYRALKRAIDSASTEA
jgi:DNA invertase Pin-like site-specific DNA recombinase